MLDEITTTDANTPDNPDELGSADSFKALRRLLKARFPATKFSVRMSRGTAYGMGNVSWTDGPSDAAVRGVVAMAQSEGFDGMTDSTTRLRTPALFDEHLGRYVRLNCRLIARYRTLSPAFRERIAQAVARRFGVAVGSIPATERERERTSPEGEWSGRHEETWSSWIGRAAQDRTLVAAD